jgi:hypothetical protein
MTLKPRGRDATDVAISTSLGPCTLTGIQGGDRRSSGRLGLGGALKR